MEVMEKQILYEKVRAEEPVTKKTPVMRNHRVQEGNTRFNSRASSRASRASDSALESLTVLTVRPAHSQACTKGACALRGCSGMKTETASLFTLDLIRWPAP